MTLHGVLVRQTAVVGHGPHGWIIDHSLQRVKSTRLVLSHAQQGEESGIDVKENRGGIETSDNVSYARRRSDPYRAAGQRLESLLRGLGRDDGEEEIIDSMLSDTSVEKKLALAGLAGSIASGGAWLAMVLLGLDPLGGARLQVGSVQAGLVGLAVSVPLVVFKQSLWSDDARRQLPFVEDIQSRMMEEFRPILSGMNVSQSMMVMVFEVVPTVLLVIPALTAGVAKLLEMYRTSLAVYVPETIPPILGLAVAALLAGISKIIDESALPEEYDVIKDALDNADRYYTVMGGPGEEKVDQKAAFEVVALTWLARRQVAARFAGAVSSFEVFYLGLLWLETGDLTAPMMAALAITAVDFWNIHHKLSTSVE